MQEAKPLLPVPDHPSVLQKVRRRRLSLFMMCNAYPLNMMMYVTEAVDDVNNTHTFLYFTCLPQ